MLEFRIFKRNSKYESLDLGSYVGRYCYGIHKEWQIDEHYTEVSDELYYTIEGVEEKFSELSEAEEVLYNLYCQDDKLTEDYNNGGSKY